MVFGDCCVSCTCPVDAGDVARLAPRDQRSQVSPACCRQGDVFDQQESRSVESSRALCRSRNCDAEKQHQGRWVLCYRNRRRRCATSGTWQSAGDERVFKIIVSPEFGERMDLEKHVGI
jgi:hypothetical protein